MVFKLISFLLVLSMSVMANDLPQTGFVLTQRASNVDVNQLLAANVTKQEVEVTNGSVQGKAVLELLLNVEGNLCMGEPSGVSALITDDFVTPESPRTVRLISAYQNDPYDFKNYACAQYGVDSYIRLPIQLFVFSFQGQPYKETYKIAVRPHGEVGQKTVNITVTWKNGQGFQTIIH